jgi:membrane protease YdiL (CAAX protease family)
MGFTARRWLNDSIRSVIGFLAILPVCFFLLIATTWLILQWDPNTNLLAPHAYLQILIDSDVPMVWRTLLVLAAVVLAPLGEEIFFRGLLQSMFRRYLQQPWVAILLTSMLFSAVHFTDIKSLPALFALSMALGYNYERTGRLYSPIMIHMLFNMVNIAEMFTNTAI